MEISLLAVADVVGLAGLPLEQDLEEAGDRIGDVAECPRLLSVAMNRKRAAVQRLDR